MEAATQGSGDVPPLFSPAFQRDPYPTYRRHLAGATVQPMQARPGFWMIFGYDACAKIIRDTSLSSKRRASMLVGVPGDAMAEFDDLVSHMQRWLLLRDGSVHAEYRKRMNRGFAPAVIEKLNNEVASIVEDLLDDMQKSATADIIHDFAYPLPVRVICRLLGLPEDLHARCVVLSDHIADWFGDLQRPADKARVAQSSIRELEGYFADTIRERGGRQENDLLGLLIEAAKGVDGMSEADLHAQCVMLLFAGHETTRNLIGNGMNALLRNPEAMRELREDSALCPAAVEEMLRYDCPVQAVGRVVMAEMDIEGTRVPAGASLAFMIGAAHRDPRQYADPDRLNFRRPHNRHLAFGGDAHVCLGSTLARMEGRLSISGLLRRFPKLCLVDELPDWGNNFGLRGLNTLRVRY
jgi:cytochrome P450